MSYDYDYNEEFCNYHEQSVADEIFREAKEKLINALSYEIKSEIEASRLLVETYKKENVQLKEKVRDIERRERELVTEKTNLLSKVKRERLSEILKELQVNMYRAKTKSMYLPKCDKCDNNRDIIYISPRGKTMKESCECDKSVSIYTPTEDVLKEFNLRDGKINAWYKLSKCEDEEYYTYNGADYRKVTYKNQPYETLKSHDTWFGTLEECQAYCDWLNRDVVIADLVEDRVLNKQVRAKKSKN